MKRPRALVLVLLVTLFSLAVWVEAISQGSLFRHANAQENSTVIEWPDTPAAKFAQAYFKAFNTEGTEALHKFMEEHYSSEYLKESPIETEISGIEQIRQQVGKLILHRAEAKGDYGIKAIVRSAKLGLYLKFDIDLDPNPPHDPKGVFAQATRAPSQTPPKQLSEWETLEELAEQVRRDCQAPALAVAVWKNGKPASEAAVGSRSQGGTDPVTERDLFHIGSIAKSFTGTLAGRLVEAGKLSWNLTVEQALPDYEMLETYRNVTLEQLLQHRGGVPAIASGGEFEHGFANLPPRSALAGREALLRQVLQEEPVGKPGEKMVYSNTGYVLAATMMEASLGNEKSWEKLIQELIYDPLPMRSGGFAWPATKERPDQPRGHFGIAPDLRVQELGEHAIGGLDLTTYLAPAGDLHCTVDDLARYGSMHIDGLNGKDGLLKAETIRKLHTPLMQIDKRSGYASGWGIKRAKNGEPLHWHNGSGGTFFALLFLYRESELAVSIATNTGLGAEPFLVNMMEAIHERMAAGKR